MPEIKYYWENPIDPKLIRLSWEQAFQRVLPENQWDRIWQWRFVSNPFSRDILASYVVEDNCVACFYAISPLIITDPNEKAIKSGLMNSGFTNPRFQGRGYYLEMNVRMHERIKAMGYELLIGFANGNSHYSYRKYLEWEDMALMTNFTLNVEKVKKISLSSQVITMHPKELTEKMITQMSKGYVAKHKYQVQRSFDYLKWRLLDHPTLEYSVLTTFIGKKEVAYTIIKVYKQNTVDLMEIFYANKEDLHDYTILSSIVSTLMNIGYSIINTWSNLFDEEHLNLEKIGFCENSVTTHFGEIRLSPSLKSTSVSEWHYRFLDSDIY